ncbi:Acetyl esterase/lipase [Cognatiyoonia koreensis]|uniref:Acetyl esterase/lipase n=1 Tax=Cognatiyoonia koreensis TaxID=364200 RepID=A0A1I0QX74_9RHOB|nr:alpha/beta hydrolase [Cognatiyoonia koreensis]SEW31623.1 Acetyl esterase/lipase [Cognatiyoonia koreensis]
MPKNPYHPVASTLKPTIVSRLDLLSRPSLALSMLSRSQKLLNVYARYVQKPCLAAVSNNWLARKTYTVNAIMAYKTPMGYRQRDVSLTHDGCTVSAAYCSRNTKPTNGTLLYIHGGGFIIGNLRGCRHVIAELAALSGQRGVYVDWRLAPEHPFPAGLDDAETAYMALLADPESGPITIAGDSAGGNLTLALLHRLLRKGVAPPAACVCFSPIVDLHLINPSLAENLKKDALVPMSWGQRGVDAYLSGQDPNNPEISPIFGSFKGAGPVLIQCDRHEVLYDDGCLMADKLRADGVEVTLTTTTALPHVWQYFVGRSPEADASVAEAAAFLKNAVAAAAELGKGAAQPKSA